VADDASAVYANPAGLTQLPSDEATAMHVMLFEDTIFDYAGYVQTFEEIGTFGAGVVRLGSTGFKGFDAQGNPLPDFGISETACQLSYSRKIMSALSVGSDIKLVNQNVESYSDTSAGFDLSMLYQPFYCLNVGINARNVIAPRIKLRSVSDVFPFSVRLGVACKLLDEDLVADVDLEKTIGQVPKIYFGAEGWVHPMFCLRAGINNSEIAAGLGIRYQSFQLDYGAGIHNLGVSHRFSLTYRFGSLVSTFNVVPPAFSPTGGRQTNVTFMINIPSNLSIVNWQMVVLDKEGMVCKSFSGIGIPPASLVWNGRDDLSRIMTQGTYTVILSVIDKDGRISSTQRKVEIIAPLRDVFTPVKPVEITK